MPSTDVIIMLQFTQNMKQDNRKALQKMYPQKDHLDTDDVVCNCNRSVKAQIWNTS